MRKFNPTDQHKLLICSILVACSFAGDATAEAVAAAATLGIHLVGNFTETHTVLFLPFKFRSQKNRPQLIPFKANNLLMTVMIPQKLFKTKPKQTEHCDENTFVIKQIYYGKCAL